MKVTKGHGKITLELDPVEIQEIRDLGRDRQESNEQYGFGSRKIGGKIDDLQQHIYGACGEIAISRYYGLPERGVVSPYKAKGTTAAKGIRIYTTIYGFGHLLIRKKDPDDQQVVFGRVDRDLAYVELFGWIYAHEGKRDDWWDADLPKPAWKVPKSALHDPDTLLTGIQGSLI